jgi:hypothetical protein
LSSRLRSALGAAQSSLSKFNDLTGCAAFDESLDADQIEQNAFSAT